MKTSFLIFVLIFLAGCVQPTTQNNNDNALVAEKEKFLSDCMGTYKDLLQKYNALVARTGGLPPDDKELNEFITEYRDIRNKYDALLKEHDQIKAEKEKLIASNKLMQLHIDSMEGKLRLVQKMVSHLKDVLHNKPALDNIVVKTNTKTDGIIFEHSLLFGVGRSELSDEGKDILCKLAENLNTPEYRKFSIRVDGHTDSTPVSKTKNMNIDNWFLGAKRAHEVLSFLVSCGIERDRLSLASFGEYAPLVQNKNLEESDPRNRRVEIILLEK